MDRTRLEQIAKEIREEFCTRVIPSDIFRYLECLTTQDIEKVQAEEKQNGAIQAAEILFQRLVRRCDWLPQLIKSLPEVGLEDFGERVEQKSRQLTVTIDAPGRCSDGLHCGEESTSVGSIRQTLEKITPDTLSTPSASKLDCEESSEELKIRIKYKVFDKILDSVKSPRDFPEMMAFAEHICTRIDQIVHKCILMMFRMETEEKLEAFWQLYETGGLAAALSRDILTPERRQQMIEDAKIEGVELLESDFSLQVNIQESDYAFVKDVLRNKNVPLLARNSFESVLLHGKGNFTRTQDERNKMMSDFRRIMPTKLQIIIDDPFIRDLVPEYFDEIAKQGAIKSVQFFYAMIITKLQSEFKNTLSDPANHLLHLAYVIAQNPNLECSFRKQGDNIEVSTSTSKIVIPKTSLKYFQINSNNIRFNSTLVLTFLAFEYIDKVVQAGNKNVEMTKLSYLEYFPVIAGALYEPMKMDIVVQELTRPSKIIMEYLYYCWLMTGTVDFRPLRDLSYLDWDMSTSFLYLAARNAENIQLGIYVPLSHHFITSRIYSGRAVFYGAMPELTMKVSDIATIPVSNQEQFQFQMGGIPVSAFRSVPRFPPVILHRTDENDFNFLSILNDTPTAERLCLPDDSKDVISYVLSIARGINLEGSGKINLKQVTDPRYFLIDYQLLPSGSKYKGTINNDDHDDSIKIGPLAIVISSFHLRDLDFSQFEHAFASGLEVRKLQLSGTGLTSAHITRLSKAAMTTNITNLILTGNTLFTSKPEPGSSIGLGSLVTLEVLEMRDCRLGNMGIEALKKDFLALRKLRCIDVSKNGITELGLKTLCKSLQNSNGIRVLRIHENDFGPNGGLIISILLQRLDFVEILNLCYCGLGDQGIMALANAMEAKTIRKINLRGNDITTIGSLEFFKCFKECPRLNHIEYSQNEIGKLQRQTGIRIIPAVPDDLDTIGGDVVDMLWSCQKSIEYLGLWECGIGNTSILDDSRLFSGMTELTELILQTNELQHTHAGTLGECLPVLENLQSLVLRDNNIGPVGAGKLTNGIARCPSLRKIMLDYNKINDFEVLTDIVKAATKALHKLQELDISFNVEMMLIAREDVRYKRLLEVAQNSLEDPEIKEEQMKTKIESTFDAMRSFCDELIRQFQDTTEWLEIRQGLVLLTPLHASEPPAPA